VDRADPLEAACALGAAGQLVEVGSTIHTGRARLKSSRYGITNIQKFLKSIDFDSNLNSSFYDTLTSLADSCDSLIHRVSYLPPRLMARWTSTSRSNPNHVRHRDKRTVTGMQGPMLQRHRSPARYVGSRVRIREGIVKASLAEELPKIAL
jgi:hypothetical protein